MAWLTFVRRSRHKGKRTKLGLREPLELEGHLDCCRYCRVNGVLPPQLLRAGLVEAPPQARLLEW